MEYAPLEHLLAMKMVAMRDRDYPDIAELAHALGMGDADSAAFEQLLRNAYGDDETLGMALGIRRDEDLDTEVTHRGRDTCRIVRHLSG